MTLAALLPENAIVTDDSVTSGRLFFPATFNAAPHDWIQSHRRRDRPRLSVRHGCCGGLPGSQGGVPAGRRSRHVLAPGAVDSGTGEA